jgi:hypothetical protein
VIIRDGTAIEETVICWTPGDETDLSLEKYQESPTVMSPTVICVPVSVAPNLPPSIVQRAYVKTRSDSGAGGNKPPSVNPPAGAVTQPTSQAVYAGGGVASAAQIDSVRLQVVSVGPGVAQASQTDLATGIMQAVNAGPAGASAGGLSVSASGLR